MPSNSSALSTYLTLESSYRNKFASQEIMAVCDFILNHLLHVFTEYKATTYQLCRTRPSNILQVLVLFDDQLSSWTVHTWEYNTISEVIAGTRSYCCSLGTYCTCLRHVPRLQLPKKYRARRSQRDHTDTGALSILPKPLKQFLAILHAIVLRGNLLFSFERCQTSLNLIW